MKRKNSDRRFFDFLRSSNRNAEARKSPRSRSLRLESLEERQLLSAVGNEPEVLASSAITVVQGDPAESGQTIELTGLTAADSQSVFDSLENDSVNYHRRVWMKGNYPETPIYGDIFSIDGANFTIRTSDGSLQTYERADFCNADRAYLDVLESDPAKLESELERAAFRQDVWDPAGAAETSQGAPDLDVLFISRTPGSPALHGRVDYPDGVPQISPAGISAFNGEYYLAEGAPTEFVATVANYGDAACGSFEAQWKIDGVNYGARVVCPPLAVGERIEISVDWTWTNGAHTVTLELDPDNEITETCEWNNQRTDSVQGAGFVVAISEQVWERFRQSANLIGSKSPEDFLQWHMDIMNQKFSEAFYEASPDGCDFRVRIDRILISTSREDGNAKVAEYSLISQGNWSIESDYSLPTTSPDWGLIHEWGHQLGLIDYYRLDIPAESVRVTDDYSRPLNIGRLSFPDVMMHSHGANPFCELTAAALNRQITVDGQQTPRGFYGDYLFEMCDSYSIRVLDRDGRPLANSQVDFYQRNVQNELITDSDLAFTVVTDANGIAALPNRTSPVATTTGGFTSKDNPFGQINVVGINGLFLVRARQANGESSWSWLEIQDFCVPAYRGETSHTFEIQTTLSSLPCLDAPTVLSATPSGNAVVLTVNSSPDAIGYAIQFKTASDADFTTYRRVYPDEYLSSDQTTTSFRLPHLDLGTEYQIRLKALGDDVANISSTWSGIVSATTGTSATTETPSIVVTARDDAIDPYDGLTSLREAIACAGTSGLGTTIVFDPSLKGGTIRLNGEELTIDRPMTVDASALWDVENDAPGLTIDGQGFSRVFHTLNGTQSAPIQLLGLTIANGSAFDGGGLLSNCELVVRNCAIENCVSTGNGGGFLHDSWDKINLYNVVARNNFAAFNGGGGFANSPIYAENSEFVDNVATYDGGGLYLNYTSTLANCLVLGNETGSDGRGGGICVRGTAQITNATFVDNESPVGADIFAKESGRATLNNSIVAVGAATAAARDSAATLAANNSLSLFANWTSGANNYAYDPNASLFADAANGDYQLAEDSQAIDRGNNVFVETDYDLAGNRRVANGRVDLGVFEYQTEDAPAETPSTIVTTAEDVVNACDGLISLREAIAYAGTGDLGTTITFDASLKDGTIRLNGEELTIDRPVTVDASALWDAENDSPGLTIDGQGFSRVFHTMNGTQSDPIQLLSLTIANGNASQGAGVNNGGGSSGELVMRDCIVKNCVSSGVGGGLYHGSGDKGGLYNVVFENNYSGDRGGGIFSNGQFYAENCRVVGNQSKYDGGGLYLIYNSTVVNCLVANNSTGSNAKGGGIGILGNAEIVGSTIVDNAASLGTSLSTTNYGRINVKNSIVALTEENEVSIGADTTLYAFNTLSSFTGWTGGSNNYVYDPNSSLFVDAANGDYRLAEDSQAIDRGNNAYVATDVDLSGYRRVANGRVDLGAFEFQTEDAPAETPSTIVTTTEDVVDACDGLISLREAIDYAGTDGLGTTITFDASLKGGTITLGGSGFNPGKSIAIDAYALWDAENDVPGVAIDANQASGFFNTNDALSLKGLTFQNGKTTGHGPIEVYGGFEASYCVFSNNEGKYGGVLKTDDCDVSIDHCSFFGNRATSEGGALRLYHSLNVAVSNSTFDENVADDYGGAVYLVSPSHFSVVDSSFDKNATLYHDGGAIYLNGGSFSFEGLDFTENGSDTVYVGGALVVLNANGSIQDSSFIDNNAKWRGGAVNADGGDVSIDRCVFGRNYADMCGGAIRAVDGTLSVLDSAFANNSARDEGGAIKVDDTPTTVDNCVFTENAAGLGGAAQFSHSSSAVISDSTFVGNYTTQTNVWNESTKNSGGALYFTGGISTVTECAFVENVADDRAGAVFYNNPSQAFVTGSDFSKNATNGGSGGAIYIMGGNFSFDGDYFIDNSSNSGGAVCVADSSGAIQNATFTNNKAQTNGGALFGENGTLSVVRCEFVGNEATGEGGAIRINGRATFENVLFAGNSASGNGGGVYAGPNSTFTGATIVGNSASGTGGGVYGNGVTFRNSIIVLNEGSDVVNSAVALNTLSTFTAWSNASSEGVVNYVYDATLPLFADPANGDYRLAMGSQAVDKGDNAFVQSDLDLAGNERIQNDVVDLGAYESLAPLDAPIVSTPSTTKSAVSFKITAVENATGYVVEYGTDPTFETCSSKPYASAGSKTISGLGSGTTYYFRVKAVGDGRADSDWTTFDATTKPAQDQLPAPIVSTPSTTKTAVSFKITAVENATGYFVEYGTDPTFETCSTKSYSSAGVKTITGLTYATTYYVRVKATGTGYADSAWTIFEATTLAPPAETKSTVVTTLADSVDPYDGAISLREAIDYAGTDGLGTTITFDASLKGGTITLGGSELAVGKELAIDASALWDAENDAPGIAVSGNNASRVLNVTASFAMTGVTITGGNSSAGAGLLANGSGLSEAIPYITLTGCAFIDNASNSSGGGAYVGGVSEVSVVDCAFKNNSARFGGGICVYSANASFDRCNISLNESTGVGAGLAAQRCSLTMSDSSITGNSTDGNGGGLHFDTVSLGTTITIMNCLIKGNIAGNIGGGAYVVGNMDSSVVFYDCEISANSAERGGGLTSWGIGVATELVNCTIAGNSASLYGGVISGVTYSGIPGSVTLTNTIIANNYSGDGIEFGSGGSAYVGPKGSNYQVGGDPLFAVAPQFDENGVLLNADQIDLRLSQGSPAIDAGDNAFVQSDLDLAGSARIQNGVVDLGAYESLAPLDVPTITLSGTKNAVVVKIDPVDGAEKYVVEYSTDSKFSTYSTKTYSSAGVKTLSGLSTGTWYYVRVKATATGRPQSAYTPVAKAYTGGKLAMPAFSASAVKTSITLNIKAVEGGEKYVVEYSENEDFSNAKTKTFSSGVRTITGLTFGTKYYIRVKATSSTANNSAWNVLTFAAGQLATPSRSATSVGVDFVKIKCWNSPNNSGFEIRYSTSSDFSDTQYARTEPGKTVCEVTGLASDTKYYFSARALGDNVSRVDSNWSPLFSATTKAAPASSAVLDLDSAFENYFEDEFDEIWDVLSETLSK